MAIQSKAPPVAQQASNRRPAVVHAGAAGPELDLTGTLAADANPVKPGR